MTNNGLPSIFDACTPRQDILEGNFEAGLAADLTQVAVGEANPEYADPAKFFAATYPTKGIRELLRQVLVRLGGGGGVAHLQYSGLTHLLVVERHMP